MTAPRALLRWGGLAAMAYAVGSLAVGAAELLVVGGKVPDPAQLLDDVAENRALWVLSQGTLAVLQLLLVPFGAAWLAATAPRRRGTAIAALCLFGAGGLLLVSSGVFHGVLGVHLASPVVLHRDLHAALLRDVELVHAFADTSFFAGGIAVGAALVVSVWVTGRRGDGGHGAFPPGLSRVALAAALFEAVQFAWFLVPDAGAAAPVAAALQASWFTWTGWCLFRLAHRARVPQDGGATVQLDTSATM